MVFLYELACSCQKGTIFKVLPEEIGEEIPQEYYVSAISTRTTIKEYSSTFKLTCASFSRNALDMFPVVISSTHHAKSQMGYIYRPSDSNVHPDRSMPETNEGLHNDIDATQEIKNRDTNADYRPRAQ